MPPSDNREANDTKLLLLDAAERMIAEHGVKGTSLRQITEDAGVNVALVKYHFGSKDELIEAMLERRMAPLNEKRIQLLKQVLAEHPEGELPLEKVLTALIEPAVEFGLQTGEVGRRFLRIFGRIFAEPAAAMQIVRRQMGPMIRHFDAAFARALPGMTDADMAWRKMACLGVVQHSLLMMSMMDELPLILRFPIKLLRGAPEPELVVAQLVAFSAAGMRAKVVPV